MLNRKETIHFIGIGGAGMFPMAEIIHRNGYSVTGSDSQESDAVKQLRDWNIDVQIGHEPNLVKNADIVVYTSAVSLENPELVAAKECGAVIMKRAVMLGDLMRRSFSIAVAGTHGKTTTTSLVAQILAFAEKAPTVVVGGILRGRDTVTGAMVGNGDILVAEADEYDRSFLQMYPSVAIVTNIEEDHLDIYRDLDDIRDTFTEFVHRVPFYGQMILCIDDEGVRSIMDRLDKPVVTYGFSDNADFCASNVKTVAGQSIVTVTARGYELGEVTLPMIGTHNIQNALAAIVVAHDMGIDFETISTALYQFPGVKRRMELMGREQNISIVDDYAHHPTEVAATLKAVQDGNYSRVTVVFQPHLYSRTADFYNEFASALGDYADRVVLLPIYKARELPVEGVSSKLIADKITQENCECHLLEKDEMVRFVTSDPKENEIILLMGAGDVWHEGSTIITELKKRG